MHHAKLAFLFPGQGAQYPGMAKDFYDQFSLARQTFEEADDILGQRISKLIFEGPASELTLTKNSQVGIYIASIAIWRVIQEQFPVLRPSVCAGLSLGEYTALTASLKISFKDCLSLVQARAQNMNDACMATEGTMCVVLGMEELSIAQAIKDVPQVWIANLNCPGQVVIAGAKTSMQAAEQALKACGAKRVLPLDVSGAFHSGLMRGAQERLEPYIAAVPLSDSPIDMVMNVPGGYVSDIAQIRSYMIDQVTCPVRWEQGIRAMMEKEISLYLEMGCGKTLAGMNKRIGVSAPMLSIEKTADLDELQKLLDTSYATTIER